MADEVKLERAKQVYKTMCEAIERREWQCKRNDEKLYVYFGVSGEDIPMRFYLMVDVERQLIRVDSPLPFKMSEANRMEGAVATCVASFGLLDGSFDYDVRDGSISFRMTASFIDSNIGEGLLQYIISASCAVVDKFNDKFLAIDKGLLSITDFITKK